MDDLPQQHRDNSKKRIRLSCLGAALHSRVLLRVKIKVRTLDIAPLRESSPQKALRYGTCSRGISQFYLHTHTFDFNSTRVQLLIKGH